MPAGRQGVRSAVAERLVWSPFVRYPNARRDSETAHATATRRTTAAVSNHGLLSRRAERPTLVGDVDDDTDQ